MKKKKLKDILSDEQFRIQCKSKRDTASTNLWLHQNGINFETFENTDPLLLQAQKKAQELLKLDKNLLTASQIKTIQDFRSKMSTKQIRKNLKPQAAYPILNISNKINRQLFNLHKKI
jgi:hypothetical protein